MKTKNKKIETALVELCFLDALQKMAAKVLKQFDHQTDRPASDLWIACDERKSVLFTGF